jgi:co-chaperonin GroES (HSP10)
LRGWIFPSEETQTVSLGLAIAGAEERKPLANTKDAVVAAQPGYAANPAGTTLIELKSGDRVLASKSGGLRAERHYTAVAWNKDGRWELEVYADDSASANAPDRSLRVLNFALGRDTEISVDGGAEALVSKESVAEIKLPAKTTMVTARVKSLDGGAPAQSSVEIDFAAIPSAYVVIGPDYRGRMRPRVIEGGNLFMEETASVSPDQ